jgi:hypothetical protein
VEVYVDGLGWVQVEVTGSEGDPDVPPVTPPESQMVELELIPAFTHKVYDGEYLYPKAELVLTPTLETLLDMGYTYEVEISGARREVGDGVTVVSRFVLYNSVGEDVTHLFRSVKRNGLLRVTPAAVEILLYPLVKTYDGLPALWGEGDYVLLSAPDGVTVSLTVTLPADRLGSLSLSELNRDAASYAEVRVYRNGADVSGSYTVVFTLPDGMEEMPVLTVNARPLELTAASETRVDNGEPLVNPTVYVTKGSLAVGHTLEAVATGRREGVGSSSNTVDMDSLRILDAEGRDVTGLYRVTPVDGVLTLVADGTGS